MRFSICVEMLFPELSFLEKVRRIAGLGFGAVEFWSWTDKPIDALAGLARETGLEVTAFSGHRSSAPCNRADRDPFREELALAIETAGRLGCPNLMVLSDALDPQGRALPLRGGEITLPGRKEALVETLQGVEDLVAGSGVTLLLEPLNTRVDHPGYTLDSSGLGFEIVREVGRPWLRLLYDVYHMQIMEGNVIATLRENADLLGYVHVADVPGRGEPGTGELNMPNILRALAAAGYDGIVGFE
ncbi:hydroxypyruvate isomerase family protein, partial [Thermodesulfobacteriota bacterium]